METTESRIDRFYADMTDALMEDTIDDMQAADSDFSPVPSEYIGMSFSEVLDDIAEHAMETLLAELARNQIPYRWM